MFRVLVKLECLGMRATNKYYIARFEVLTAVLLKIQFLTV